MPYASLRDFMSRLEAAGRLKRVAATVSPHLEMTEIQTRLLAEAGPAVLFENVATYRSAMPVLVNLFGTVERVAWGMDREPHQLREIGQTLAFLKQPEPPGGWREALDMLPLLKTVMAMRPRTVNAAPCQEIVLRGADIDLAYLPVQTCWPGEPAPLITWPLVVTRGPGAAREDGFNLGIYRMQVTGRDTTLMRWLRHRGGAQHHQRWRAGQARAAARRGGDRRRPRHDPRRGDAGARHAVGIPVRRSVARQAARSRAMQDRAAQGAGGGRDRARRPCLARRIRRRRALRRPHRLLQCGRSNSRCFACRR